MSQSLESSTLHHESNSYPLSSSSSMAASSSLTHQDTIIQATSYPNNDSKKDTIVTPYTRGRANLNNISTTMKSKPHSMISHVVQGSPKHFSITNKLNESFEDNSTQHRNSSFSNSNGGGSFISRSGHGRILSEQNLSPLCNKISDVSSGGSGFNNSFNYGHRQINTSTSSYSSLNDNLEINNTLLLAKEYLEKDESLIDMNMFDILIDELLGLNSSSIKEYYMKIISSFQNDDEFSQFFNENQFVEDSMSKKQIPQQQSHSSIYNASSNMNSMNEATPTSPSLDTNDFLTFDTIQDFDNSSQNLKVGSAMSSLIFQINPQKHFRNTMILTFDYFMTPLTFLLYIIKCYYIPTPIGQSEKEAEKFDKRIEQIRINIGQVIRDYVEIRSCEFLQSNITSVLLIVFFQTIPANSKEKNLFNQLQEKVKSKKTQYELENVQKRNKNSSTLNAIYNNSILNNNNQTQSLLYQPKNSTFTYPQGYSQSLAYGSSSTSIANEQQDMLKMRRKNDQIQRQIAIYDPSPLIHYSTELIAKVMTQIDSKWFIRLNLSNLINSKINNRSKFPYVQKYSTRFNYYVYWFINQVLSQKSIEMRVNQIIQYIEIMCCIDQEYHSYPSVHVLYTVISYLKTQIPLTWQRLENRLRDERKWMSITLELQRYQAMFNDKYYGYKKEVIRHTENRQNYIPCMNPYFQDIYNDEMKFTAASAKKNSSGNQLIVPIVIHERIGDRLLNLSILQKSCEKAFPNIDVEYKDFRNYKNDESQLYTLFKKKCIKEIDDIMSQNAIQFKDLELYFIGKCKQIEPN